MMSEVKAWMWCSVGYTPKDAANGVCPDFWKLPYGCHSCKKWKLTPEEDILKANEEKDVE